MPQKGKFKEQGDALERARGSRTFKEIAKLLGVSVGRYQNWEYGRNRPGPNEWPKIKDRLGVDPSKLYAGVQGYDKATEPALDADAVLGLVTAIERNLAALRILCAPHISNRRLEQNGIKDPRQKKSVTN